MITFVPRCDTAYVLMALNKFSEFKADFNSLVSLLKYSFSISLMFSCLKSSASKIRRYSYYPSSTKADILFPSNSVTLSFPTVYQFPFIHLDCFTFVQSELHSNVMLKFLILYGSMTLSQLDSLHTFSDHPYTANG